jgi:outer membrane protein assembly factor BamD (BamD/ComL family)
MRARVLVRQRRYEEALKTLRGAADDGTLPETERAAAWVQMGKLAELQNNWDEARRDYVGAYTNFPLTDEGMKAPLAIVQHSVDIKDQAGIRRDWIAARDNYADLLNRYPESSWVQEVRWLLVDAHIALEEWPAAVQLLGQISDLQPRTAAGLRALRMMAQLHEIKMHAPRAAAEDYKKVVTRFPDASFRPQVEAEIRRLGG